MQIANPEIKREILPETIPGDRAYQKNGCPDQEQP